MNRSKFIILPAAAYFILTFSVTVCNITFAADIQHDDKRIVLNIPRGGEPGDEKFTLGTIPSAFQAGTGKTKQNKIGYEKDIGLVRGISDTGGHGGSHPHLVHEFVRSIVEGRKPRIDEVTAANWTAAGICAHASAMQGGARVIIPDFGAPAPQV